MSLGNHDYQGIVDAQLNYRGDPRWNLPSRNYTMQFPLTKKNATFVFLDTSPFISDYYTNPTTPEMAIQLKNQHWQAQAAWLDAVLTSVRKNDPQGWIIVFGHHWIYSSKGIETDMENNIKPLLKTHGVATYISGHIHQMEAFGHEGHIPSDYFISGAGGKVPVQEPKRENAKDLPLRGVKQNYVGNIAGFFTADLDDDTLKVTYYDNNQTVLYTQSVARPSPLR